MADLALFVAVEAPLMTILGGRPLLTGVFSSKRTAPRLPAEAVAAALLPLMRRTAPPRFRWSIDAWLRVGLIRGEVLLFFWRLRKNISTVKGGPFCMLHDKALYIFATSSVKKHMAYFN